MGSVLLDTHTFIWLVEDNSKLPRRTKSIIEESEHIFVSIVTFWEIALKLKKEKILLNCDFNQIEQRFTATDLELLPIDIADTVQFYQLPFYRPDHKDPFDRLLISQAMTHHLSLVSCDAKFDAYPIEKIWL
jgi:PIN domain nuclease of toxin-antitoxin system